MNSLTEAEPQDEKMVFLPYHAINELMRDDFRVSVIREVLQSISKLSGNSRKLIETQVKKVVNIPGFRNSVKAPLRLQIKPVTNAFIKEPKLVIAIITAWTELHSELSGQIALILKERNWEVLPKDADRDELPGFLPRWPQGEDFNSINDAYIKLFSETKIDPDVISLMSVWLSGSLPYENITESKDTENS